MCMQNHYKIHMVTSKQGVASRDCSVGYHQSQRDFERITDYGTVEILMVITTLTHLAIIIGCRVHSRQRDDLCRGIDPRCTVAVAKLLIRKRMKSNIHNNIRKV